MKKEVILVPKDKCPLDVITKMEERIKNSWIFLHDNAVDKLKNTADRTEEVSGEFFEKLEWYSTEKYLKRSLIFESSSTIWHRIYDIITKDLEFEEALDPEDIYFLKMAE